MGEMERLNISAGSHKIQTKIGSVLQLGTGGDLASFVAEKEKYFFIIDYDAKLFSVTGQLWKLPKVVFKVR